MEESVARYPCRGVPRVAPSAPVPRYCQSPCRYPHGVIKVKAPTIQRSPHVSKYPSKSRPLHTIASTSCHKLSRVVATAARRCTKDANRFEIRSRHAPHLVCERRDQRRATKSRTTEISKLSLHCDCTRGGCQSRCTQWCLHVTAQTVT